ncbi:MAG: peptidoglycan DD-metalloendopeptidase family protein [Legionellaceae bacterium]|nr:peptidoglycan DD-metalloendopeptidase family protein [Legionellaceae bacterium]
MIRIYISHGLLSLLLCTNLWAGAPSEKTAKLQLSQLERSMTRIKSQLSVDKKSRDKIYRDLALTEKKLGDDLRKLHTLGQQEEQKKQAINTLIKRIDPLKQQLKTQQLALSNHVRARHRLGALHPWEWLLHQEAPRTIARLFVFYHYLFKADQQLIEDIRNTMKSLEDNQRTLTLEQKNLQKLEDDVMHHQQHLSHMKQEQRGLIDALDKTIQSKRDQLKTYQQDKERLRALLKKLAHKKYRPQQKTFNFERSHLPYPLKNRTKETKPLNQGMVFLAREGTPVVAVLSGKVIFSDWLKGYGLLIIIDHGEGFLSLYAHNASLFASQGATVNQGQQIATVGHTGGLRENGLYFEVRRRGRAVPPRQWMS